MKHLFLSKPINRITPLFNLPSKMIIFRPINISYPNVNGAIFHHTFIWPNFILLKKPNKPPLRKFANSIPSSAPKRIFFFPHLLQHFMSSPLVGIPGRLLLKPPQDNLLFPLFFLFKPTLLSQISATFLIHLPSSRYKKHPSLGVFFIVSNLNLM